MYKPQWQRYCSQDFDIRRAVKICENLDRTVLLARSEVGEDSNDGTGQWLYGDFIVGEKYAEVCTVDMRHRVEDFEVLIADVANCSWVSPVYCCANEVKCYGGYIPDMSICTGTHAFNDEPCFVGRVDVSLDGTGKREDFRGGFILPSHAACFVPGPSDAEASVSDTGGETGGAERVSKYYEYEVLQGPTRLKRSREELTGIIMERMDEGKVLSELAGLFQQHFHGKSQLGFHDAISKLWANSGLGLDFFSPRALPWLLDLAQIHGLPSCLRQCLPRWFQAGAGLGNPEEYPRMYRLFRYSATNGFHDKFGTSKRRNPIRFLNVKLEGDMRRYSERGKTKFELEGILRQQPSLTELMQTTRMRADEFENPVWSATGHDIKSKDYVPGQKREFERTKPKSLLSPSNSMRRAPVPHSVMIQRQTIESDFEIQVTIQDEQTVGESELLQSLSQSELESCEEQARTLLGDGSYTKEVAAILKPLLVVCQAQRETGETSEAVEEYVDGQVEESVEGEAAENQLTESSVQVPSLYKIFSALLTAATTGGQSTYVSALYLILEHYIANGRLGTLSWKEMSDLLQVEATNGSVIPNELKGLLAKSLILSLGNHSEDGELISAVEEKALDFIVTLATKNRDHNLLRSIRWILEQSTTGPEPIYPTIFSKLTEFLKNMTDDEFLQNDSIIVIPILRLIADQCRTYSADTIEVTSKYLDSGSAQAGRTYCAQWLKKAATEAESFLDEKTLKILRKCLYDPDPWIKYNAREAFATEIHKQRNRWTSKTFPDAVILSDIIATEPVILTLAGQKPQYFTYSINLPILQILNYYRVQHGKSKWKVTQCIAKLFGNDSRPQESLSRGWEAALKEGLRYLGDQGDAIPAAVFEAVDKVFVEQDNYSVLPACAEFICKCVENGLNSERISMSFKFLEQLCRRLRLSRFASDRCVYLECLHVLRKWQELPDDVFQVYHIEAGVARLLSESPNNSKEDQLVTKLGMKVPACAKADVIESTHGWIEMYLRSGFLLSTGIIHAYESSSDATGSMKAGLTQAAINGQVIPENILYKVLQGFPNNSAMDKRDFELARACLKNQSLPDQVLSKILKYLRKAETCVKSESTAEACLIIICSAYLLNRKLFTISEIRKFFSDSEIGKFLLPPQQRALRSSNEKIILTLFKKFPITESDVKDGLIQETSSLFHLAQDLARKNTEEIVTGPTTTAPSRAEEEQKFRKLFKNAKEIHALRDAEYFQSIVGTLRSNSAARAAFKQNLMTLEPSSMTEFVFGGTEPPALDTLPFARVAFISMVTSRTQDAAEECREILELIFTKFVERDFRLASVLTTLGRLQKLGIKLFSCVDRLMTTFLDESRADQLNKSRRKLEGLIEQSPSLFSPVLDDFDFSDRAARWKEDRKDSYLRQGDLLEELVLVSFRKDFDEKYTSAARCKGSIDLLFSRCVDSECFKYNCPASLLIECVQEYIDAGGTVPFETDNDKVGAAVADLVYVSVISTLAKSIGSKIPKQKGAAAAGSLSQSQESIAVLVAELLEAFHYHFPKLKLFLSKLSAINVDTTWKILKSLYNPKLDPHNIRKESYEVEIQADGIMNDLSNVMKSSETKSFVASGLRYLLRKRYSFMHFLTYQEGHVVENMKAAMRLEAYNEDPFNLETVKLLRSALGHKDPGKFLVAINEHIQKIIRNRPRVALSLTELVSKLTMVDDRIGPLTHAQLLSSVKNIVGSGEGRTIPLGDNKKISLGLLTLRDIKDWAKYVRMRGTGIDPTEAICVANRAVNLWRSWDLTTIQILAIFLGLSQSKGRNLFLELSTGSGKSVVIAVIAAVKALRGNKVDIYTSNHLLVQRDTQEWDEFYNFFNLTCSSNGDQAVTYVDGTKECYNKDIVYGDMKQFQFDALRTEFMGLGTRSGRPYDDVIIDEVDSILLDEGPNLAMLSTTFTGMDKLEPIYHLIRSTLTCFDSNQMYYSVDGALYHFKGDGEPRYARDTRIENTLFEPRREYLKRNIEAFIRALLGIDVAGTESWKIEEHFQLPPHLLKYAKSQVSNWAEAAITAEALEEKKDYLLVDNKVVPIDPNSGVLQPSSNWTNGLHQFLQIKHEVDLTPESPTTNYLSNWAMVQKYEHGTVGLTGTLGSTESFRLLSQQMSADCVKLPNRHLSRFIQFPNMIVPRRQEWREAIQKVTETEISVGRAVLIICQTVKEAQGLHDDLKPNSNFRVKLHVRSDTWMEHHLQQVQPGDVIVTTNLGTRGMDIQASAIESAGGLHVVLAYMPPNTRIVWQAFGRTSRKGNLGSAHFIIKHKDGTLRPGGIMEHITHSEISEFDRYFEQEMPAVTVDFVYNDEIHCTFKDKVYADFVIEYSQARDDIRGHALDYEQPFSNVGKGIIGQVFNGTSELSGAKFIILEAIQEVWAAYLKVVLEHPPGDPPDSSVNKFKSDLRVALKEGGRDPKTLFRLTGNCYHPTRYGFQVYRKLRSLNDPQSKLRKLAGKAGVWLTKKAMAEAGEALRSQFVSRPAEGSLLAKSHRLVETAADYFTMAVDMAPKLSPAAHVGLAYVFLKRGENCPGLGTNGRNYKGDALSYLKNAGIILESDINDLRDCVKQLSNPSTSRLASQLTKKIEALEAYAKVIGETTHTVQQSLRPVRVTATNKQERKTNTVWISDGNFTPCADFVQVFESGDEIELEFHGLKANSDLGGYSFQCQSAIKLLYDKLSHANLKNAIGQPIVSLVIEGNDVRRVTTDVRRVTTDVRRGTNDVTRGTNDVTRGTTDMIRATTDVIGVTTLPRGANFWEVTTAEQCKGSLLPWTSLPGVLPSFELKFGSIQTWSRLQELTQAMSSEYRLVLRGADVPSKLRSLTKVSPSDLHEAVQRAALFDRLLATSKSKLFSKTIDYSKGNNGGSEEEKDQLTIDMTHLEPQSQKLIVEQLVRNEIPFDVSLEGVHLEDYENCLRNQKYLQNCIHVSISLPPVPAHGPKNNNEGRQEEILQALRHYCDSFRKEGITPILKLGHLGSTFAKALYDEVNRDSDPMQQLRLVPLRDLEFENTPSAEAFRQMEQQGLLLVASFSEKNAIPRKAMILVGSIAMVEFVVGAVLCASVPLVPLGPVLIKMAFSDAKKVIKMRDKREFSMVKLVVEKVAQAAQKGLAEVIPPSWLRKFFSSLKSANSMDALETVMKNHLEKLTTTQIQEVGALAATDLFFLYFEFGGLRTKVIKNIIDTLNADQQSALMLEEPNAKELCATFHALTAVIAFQKDANYELGTWLNSLDPLKLWCSNENVDGLKLVDWESLKKNAAAAGEYDNFAFHLLNAIKDAVLHNLSLLCKLACVNILEGLKSHCFELCLNVLDSSEFQPDEIQYIRQQMDASAMSPAVEVCRILDEKAWNSFISRDRLGVAREKIQKIKTKSDELLKDLNFKRDLGNTFLHLLQGALNCSEVLDYIIAKSAPLTSIFGKQKSATVVTLQRSPASLPVDHKNDLSGHSTQLSTDSTWEEGVTHRLVEKVSEGCWPESPGERAEDLSTQLPTLIMLLHEIQVDAVLLQTEDYQSFKPGDSHGSFVIVYKLAPRNNCHLRSLKVMRGGVKKRFKGSQLVLETLAYIKDCPHASVQSMLDALLETEDGKKVYNGLHQLCQTAIENRKGEPESSWYAWIMHTIQYASIRNAEGQ